jgi:hypothetical protein
VPKYSKNRSKQPIGFVLKCFKLLWAIFRDFVKFLPILVYFLLSKIFFERVGWYLFCGWKGVGAPLNSDLRPTMREILYADRRNKGPSTYYLIIQNTSHSPELQACKFTWVNARRRTSNCLQTCVFFFYHWPQLYHPPSRVYWNRLVKGLLWHISWLMKHDIDVCDKCDT